MIQLRDISTSYPGTEAASVRGLSLTIPDGQFLVLIGPSGCGKTTTLNMINRLIDPTSGNIRIDGTDIATEDPAQLRRRIGYVFQEAGLFPHLSAAQNVAITPRLLGWTRAECDARVAELLALVQLEPGLAARFPAQLSGGQRQRVALARALAARPRIMLLDEPFGALDPVTRDEITVDYRRIHDTLGLTTIMVTHDMTEALLMADRIAVMREGRLVQTGSPRDLVAQPADDFVARMIETPRRRTQALAAALGAAS